MKLILLITDIGGPVALHTLLSEIPEHLSVPIVVLPSSDVGLLESSAAALRRTVALPIQLLQPRMSLEAGRVFLGAPNTLYRVILPSEQLALEAVCVNKEVEYVRKTIANISSTLHDQLAVIFLSGRGRLPEIEKCCSLLDANCSPILVLHRNETVVFDMGRHVLKETATARELTVAEIVAFLRIVATPSAPRTLPGVPGR